MKDTLTLYCELIDSGISKEQAKIQAMQLGDVRNLISDIATQLKILHADMKWIRIIGGALIAGMAYMFLALKHLM